jgi:HEAT repeats
MTVTCPGCQTALRFQQPLAKEKRIKCPRCGEVFSTGAAHSGAADRTGELEREHKPRKTSLREGPPARSVKKTSRLDAPGRDRVHERQDRKPSPRRRDERDHERSGSKTGLVVTLVVLGLVVVAGGTFAAIHFLSGDGKKESPLLAKAPGASSSHLKPTSIPESAQNKNEQRSEKEKEKPTSVPQPKDDASSKTKEVPPRQKNQEPKEEIGAKKEDPVPKKEDIAKKEDPVPKKEDIAKKEDPVPKKEDIAKKEDPVPKKEVDPPAKGLLPPQVVADFRQALQDKNGSQRLKALKAIAGEGHKAEVLLPELYKVLLDDKVIAVRAAAARAIGNLGYLAAAALPGLGLVLEEESTDDSLPSAVIYAMRQIGRPAAPQLTAALKHRNPWVRERVLEALNGMPVDSKSTLPRLVSLLKDSDAKVRLQTVHALRDLGPGDKDVLRALGSALVDKDVRVLSEAVQALAPHGEAAAEVLPELIQVLHHDDDIFYVHAFNLLRAIGPKAKKAIPTLVELAKKGSERRRAFAVDTIARLDPSHKGLVELLKPGIAQPNPFDAARSIQALGFFGPAAKDMIPDLLKIMRSNKEPASSAAFFALANMGKDVIPTVREELKNPDKAARFRTMRIIVYLGQEAAELLPEVRAALKDPISTTRGNALWACETMGRLAAPAAGELAPLLEDPDRAVRMHAAAAVAWVGVDEAAVPALAAKINEGKIANPELIVLALAGAEKTGPKHLEGLVKHKSVIMKKRAQDALNIVKQKQIAAQGLAVLKDGPPEARFKAAVDVATANPREQVAALELIAALQDADVNKRRLAAEALGAVRFPGAGYKIIPLAKAMHDPDEKVQLAAARSLKTLDTAAGEFFARLVVTPKSGTNKTKPLDVTPDIPKREPLYAKLPDRVVKPPAAEQPIQCIVRLMAPKEKGLRSVVVFEKVTEPGPVKAEWTRGILARELVRQSLIMTVREELGLAARDLALQETFVPDPAYTAKEEIILTCAFVQGKHAHIAMLKKIADKDEVLWTKDVPLSADWDYVKFAHELEALTRQEWPQVMQKAGFGTPRPVKTSTAKLDGVDERLNNFNELTQFALVRQLHSAISDKGEAPELLGALVRAYAHLGLLTNFHWAATHKICKARSLLYAQRLVARESDSPAALWHRGYAVALLGRHANALADLAGADKLLAAAKNKSARPPWLDALDAFCKFEAGRLAKMGTPLARLLHYHVASRGESSTRKIDTASELLRDSLDCYVAWDTLSALTELGILHKATASSPAILSERLSPQLRAMPGLPKAVADLLGGDLDPDRERRVLQALSASSRLGHDEDGLAWSGFAGLVRDIRYVQVFRRLDFMARRWSVPTKDYFVDIKPWIADHPLRGHLARYGMVSAKELQDNLSSLPDGIDHSVMDLSALNVLARVMDEAEPKRGTNLARAHQDYIYQDVLRAVPFAAVEDRTGLGRRLLELSPHSTHARVILINNDWDNVKKAAIAWENTKDEDILGALAKRYFVSNQAVDAERCLLKYMDLAQDFWAYNHLSSIYKAQKRDDKWLETLEKYLQLPNLGLQHAKVQIEISKHLKAKGEKEKALDYADAAAETWAEWAMRFASQCHEEAQHWDKSELWIRRVSERYPRAAANWMQWCQRTGKGDVETATRLAKNQGAQVNPIDELHLRSQGALRNRDWKSALEILQELHKRTKDHNLLIFIALTADALKKDAERDAALKEIPANIRDGRIAAYFKDALKDPKGKLDLAGIERMLSTESISNKTAAYYFVGWFLEQHGQKDAAFVYYDRCATGASGSPFLRSLAIQILRDNGREPGKVKSP